MKIKDIIKTVDKSESNQDWVDLESIASEFGIYDAHNGDYEKFQTRMKAYWFVSWICTDTMVGGRVYFLDDMAVAVSFQRGRKCDENIEWVCKDYAIEVKKFVIECCEDDFNPSIVDLDQDIDIEEIKRYQGAS